MHIACRGSCYNVSSSPPLTTRLATSCSAQASSNTANYSTCMHSAGALPATLPPTTFLPPLQQQPLLQIFQQQREHCAKLLHHPFSRHPPASPPLPPPPHTHTHHPLAGLTTRLATSCRASTSAEASSTFRRPSKSKGSVSAASTK
mgnify:CR=1 FL=1